MTPLRLLEVFCSLALQVALLVLATGWLARTVCRDVRDRDRLWSGCLLALLLLLVYDLCLPHLRLLPVPASVVDPSLLMQFEAQAGATWWLFGLWAAGASSCWGAWSWTPCRPLVATPIRRDRARKFAGPLGAVVGAGQ